MKSLNIIFIGLTITSSWGNGHATTYRGLIKELNKKGHKILFLEKNVYWYEENRDMPHPPFCRVGLYKTTQELRENFLEDIQNADLVIVGSYVSDGVEIGWFVQKNAKGITAFYDIDTPVTLSKLKEKQFEYLTPEQIPFYDLYLSFTGGPILDLLRTHYNSQLPKALYCSVDPELYFPEKHPLKWDLGYIGTYSRDRQPALRKFLLDTAEEMPMQKFIVVGPQYPDDTTWGENVDREIHLSPAQHRKFYSSQRFTLNITRNDMIDAGYSPSVRIFEAAACKTPIISDYWKGLETFLEPDREILIVKETEDVIKILSEFPEDKRIEMAEHAMHKVLQNHTAEKRAAELEEYYQEALKISEKR